MKTILVTGAAGFIGHKTCELLLKDGHEVIGLDNLNDYYDVSIKERRKDELNQFSEFTFYKSDIENLEELKSIFQSHKFDAVMNLAARAGVRYSMENPHIYMTTNAHGTLNVLECMTAYSGKKMVLASTSSLYAGQKMPFLESLAVNEPISPYAASKKAAEAIAYSYHHLYDMDISVVRYFTVYGPNSRPDMALDIFTKAIQNETEIPLYGDGTQARDFTYVDDIARGNIAALKPLGYEVINLGGGKNPITVNTMIKLLEQNIGKKAKINNLPFHKADMKVTWADISKANELLEWQPLVEFKDGIHRCQRI